MLHSYTRTPTPAAILIERGRKTEKNAFPPSTHKPGTAHQKSPQAPESEIPVQRTVQDTPIELLKDPAWKPDREADIQMFLSVPGITSKEQLPGELRNRTLALIADRFPHTACTHVYTDGSAEEGMKMTAAASTSDTQMVTPLHSLFLVAFSAPTIELRCWLFVQLQSTCWRVGNKWEISSLTPCQPFKPSTQLIQIR